MAISDPTLSNIFVRIFRNLSNTNENHSNKVFEWMFTYWKMTFLANILDLS